MLNLFIIQSYNNIGRDGGKSIGDGIANCSQLTKLDLNLLY